VVKFLGYVWTSAEPLCVNSVILCNGIAFETINFFLNNANKVSELVLSITLVSHSELSTVITDTKY
jgi:hypothetical protein